MTETSYGATPQEAPTHNLPEYSVSELSAKLKRTVEDAYTRVRVRGEVSRLSRPSSGHLYLNLKDVDAVLAAVCWRSTASNLRFVPEDGLEVVCTGRISTYPGRSQYQLIVDTIEPAGEGALMALLNESIVGAWYPFDATKANEYNTAVGRSADTFFAPSNLRCSEDSFFT